ncbi:hypothetical protein GLYMA_17G091200v4 [Glycine max]|nr:hypothetical protein GLYMA_17G091200v4 [Glycine max]KAH1117586.1 hypothetical protein GYH30_046726 [Glycine max]
MQCFLLISAGSFTHFFLDHLFEKWLQRSLSKALLIMSYIMPSNKAYPTPMSLQPCWGASFIRFSNILLFINQENGKTTTYTWILSTGWWQSRAPVNPDAVVVVVFLCACLIGGFFYLNRANASNSMMKKSYQSMLLVMSIACLYCLWCAIQIYWISPPRPAVGEEADLGVLVFLAIYFFLPYGLCIMSMSPKDHDPNQIPL